MTLIKVGEKWYTEAALLEAIEAIESRNQLSDKESRAKYAALVLTATNYGLIETVPFHTH